MGERTYLNTPSIFGGSPGQTQGNIKDLEHHPGMDWFPLDALPDMFWPDEQALIEQHRAAIRAAFLPRAD